MFLYRPLLDCDTIAKYLALCSIIMANAMLSQYPIIYIFALHIVNDWVHSAILGEQLYGTLRPVEREVFHRVVTYISHKLRTQITRIVLQRTVIVGTPTGPEISLKPNSRKTVGSCDWSSWAR